MFTLTLTAETKQELMGTALFVDTQIRKTKTGQYKAKTYGSVEFLSQQMVKAESKGIKAKITFE